MISFTDLENAWQQQGAGAKPSPERMLQLAEQKTKQVKAKHLITIALLSITVLLIIWYFATYAAVTFNQFSIGLLLMIGSLLIRIVIEVISYSKLRKMDMRVDFKTYAAHLTRFYKKRRVLHFILTPLLYAAYVTGFVLLLQVFQEQFTKGFYYYLLVSGFGSLLVLAWVILQSNRRELKMLAHLQQSLDNV